MNLASQKRARSRLRPESRTNLASTNFREKTRVSQHSVHPNNPSWIRHSILLFTSLATNIFIFTQVSPDQIRDIPISDSYGPLLISIAVSVYSFCRLFLKYKTICWLISLFITVLISLRLQGFRDIL